MSILPCLHVCILFSSMVQNETFGSKSEAYPILFTNVRANFKHWAYGWSCSIHCNLQCTAMCNHCNVQLLHKCKPLQCPNDRSWNIHNCLIKSETNQYLVFEQTQHYLRIRRISGMRLKYYYSLVVWGRLRTNVLSILRLWIYELRVTLKRILSKIRKLCRFKYFILAKKILYKCYYDIMFFTKLCPLSLYNKFTVMW